MDIEVMMMIGFGTMALFIIAISAKLATRKKNKPAPAAAAAEDGGDFSLFKRLTAEQPENPEIWLKWGNALATSANSAKHPNMRLHRYNEACSCFQTAVEKSPSYTTAWKNWGQTLYELYRLQDCSDRLILDNAHTKFQTAVRLTPNDAQLWQLWAEELFQTAYAAQGDQKRELHDLGTSKLARAAEVNPNLPPPPALYAEGETASLNAGSMSGMAAASPAMDTAGATAAPEAEVALPWARGTSAPMEAAAWLTEGIPNEEEAPAATAPTLAGRPFVAAPIIVGTPEIGMTFDAAPDNTKS